MPAPPLSLRGVYDSLRWPTRRDLIFSIKAYCAAALALLVGFGQNLQNPYWAVLTVYIVLTPPESGAIRSKALFRLIGTVAGGMLMMAVTGLFGDQLGILLTLTIGIIATTTFLRQIIRTPANYLFFSTGVTAGVVGLTNLMQAEQMFGYATARMGEISLGILAITAVDSLIWPRPMTPDFLKTMSDWRNDARGWLIEALELTEEQSVDEERRGKVRARLRELTRAVDVIDAKAVQLPFDIVATAPRGRDLNVVRAKVAALIADLAGIETWARPLRRDELLHAHLGLMLDAVIAWMKEGQDLPAELFDTHVERGGSLVEQLERTRAGIDMQSGRTALLERGMVSRLIAFIHDWSDLGLTLRAIETGRPLPPDLRREARRSRPVRSVDYLGAARDVAPMVLSTGFTATLWYATAWSAGTGALLFSFIGCVFLIGQGAILRSSAGLMIWILVAFGFVFLYQYAILPRVTAFPTLVVVLGMAMLPFGLLMAMSTAGMLVCVYTFSFLGLQNAYAADFNQSLQTLGSSLAGLFIAVASLYLCSYDRPRFISRRLVGAVRRDIIDLARSRRLPGRQRFLFLTVDRLALYFTAVRQATGDAPLPRLRMLDDFRIGMNLLLLREHEQDVSPTVRGMVTALREETVAAFRRKLGGLDDDGRLLALIDTAIEDPAVRAEPAGDRLLESLIGMRLALSDDHSLSPPEDAPHAS